MNLEEDILIEGFLNETLSEKDKEAFLKRMESDTAFKERVAFEKQLKVQLDESRWSFIDTKEMLEAKNYEEQFKRPEIISLKEVLQKENDKFHSPRKLKNTRWIFYVSAAVIALLITLYISLPNADFSSQELYAKHINNIELASYASRDSNSQNMLVKGQEFFEAKEYAKALEIFTEELEKGNKQDATLFLYTGISEMELNKFSAAEKTFDALISSNLIDAPKGKWLKALLFLKMEQPDKAKEMLKEIIQSKTYKYREASELLKDLS